MRLRFPLTTVLMLTLPGVAFADMGTPGFSFVPRDFIFEVEQEYPGYRFWLVSAEGIEPLDFAPGRPFRVDGEVKLQQVGTRPAYVFAAPVGVIEEMGAEKVHEAWLAGKLPPRVLQSQWIFFRDSVPFFDTRERVIDRYRVEFEPGKEVRLVLLERNTGNPWVKRAWAAAGILAAASVGLAGLWVFRKLLRHVRKPSAV